MRISDWSSDVCAGDLAFDSVMLSDQDAAKRGDPRLLGVDNRLVIPAGKVVKALITADDVIHSWAVPSFWVKMDRSEEHTSELQSLMRISYAVFCLTKKQNT